MTYTLPDVADRQAQEQAIRDGRAKMLADDRRLMAELDTLDQRAEAVSQAPGLCAPAVELANIQRAMLAMLRSEITRDDDDEVG